MYIFDMGRVSRNQRDGWNISKTISRSITCQSPALCIASRGKIAVYACVDVEIAQNSKHENAAEWHFGEVPYMYN